MTGNNARYAQSIGAAALELWPDLPRDIQELLFERTVGNDEVLRLSLRNFCTTIIRARPIRRNRPDWYR